jgi:aspartate-semialdehyde dehydrogenase
MSVGLKVAVVEPATPVGAEILKVLEERGFPVERLELLGGRRSAGATVEFMGSGLRVAPIETASFEGLDAAFFACDVPGGADLIEKARRSGCLVVDLGTRSALKEDVPLVVPEINGGDLESHSGVIASPRPASVELALALAPIHLSFGVRRAVITSFHPVSEAGDMAMEELTSQIRDLFSFRDTSPRVFTHQVAFNVIPAVGKIGSRGVSEEEAAIALELGRIVKGLPGAVSVTCIRVPVFYALCASVVVQTGVEAGIPALREILADRAGVSVVDDPPQDVYPTQVDVLGMDECQVGRIRPDPVFENGVAFFTACDNVRKGSALNAVQIAELALGTKG